MTSNFHYHSKDEARIYLHFVNLIFKSRRVYNGEKTYQAL